MIDDIAQKVSERYARAAATGEQMCCPTGYNFNDLKTFIPEEVLHISYGCGTPAGLDTVRAGETVLDIGSGGGIDCFEAARRVGPSGRVIGIDMTDTMLEIARRNAPIVAKNLGHPSSNVEFRKGIADTMPVNDGSVDLIISNCVINLAPDKRKVFREMFRILKPGGRFTISDIVADQTVPQYLIHDTEKWGDCLSGALTVSDYIGGMVEAGFLGIHQIKTLPWQRIDGIQFLSITLTGYKLETVQPNGPSRFATLLGPFSKVTDELGQSYRRGVAQQINNRTARMLSAPPFQRLFVLSESPTILVESDPGWIAVLPEQKPCVWKGDFAIFTGPFIEAEDDDHHVFLRGTPLEICSKTLKVIATDHYQPHFAVINRASEDVAGTAVSCAPGGGCC
ncbi:MAG: methyltransferase domain-containing protein [Nitrospiraceae bacterium]|nr:methyltransferase domain-containing protein [Nitrospiraceae bacterium]